MAIVCVAIPHFALAVALEAEPQPAQAAVLVVDGLVRARVIDASPEAFTQGARRGMTAIEAQACVPAATTLVTDLAARRTKWEAILDALDAISPAIEDGGEGYAFCEMRGAGGTPQQWRATLASALRAFGFRFLIGVGPSRFVARVAAKRNATCQRGEEAAFVARQPLRELEIDPQLEMRLHLLGIRTLGELAALPHGPFVRRFGPQAARWHALARGIDDVPFLARPHRVRIERTLYGEGSAASEEALLFALRTLVARVAEDLVVAGKRAAALTLQLECENGEIVRVAVAVAQPTARETMLFDLIRARLEGLQLEAPVEGLRLGVERAERGGVALPLLCGDDPDPEAVELALARLDAAFGDEAAVRARLEPGGHRPESRVAYERFEPAALVSREWIAAASPHARQTATMQLRIFSEPREVDVVVSAGAPRFLGTPAQAVVDYAGPWRIDEGWWSAAPLERDDYDVMLEDGAIYRIARRGERWFTLGVYD
ncbi:MAG: DNA polymerase Y family protein [Candidatus Eremiobacteraeota bacterium]|nr:DNA polymerase Y family protein [Candidatus Eremiobacteraeota bacterium]